MKSKSYSKLLLITDIFEKKHLGGAEIYFYNLIKEVKKYKNISLLVVVRSNDKSFIKGIGTNYICIPYSSNIYVSVLLIFIHIVTLNLLFFVRNFDRIILNHPLTYFYTFLIPERRKRIIFHSPWCFEYKYRRETQDSNIDIDRLPFCDGQLIRFFAERFVYKRIQNIITLSNYMKKICIRLFRTKARIDVIYPSINVDEFEQANNKWEVRKELNIPENALVFFTARSMIPRTGIKSLIEAITMVKDMVRNCFFIIAGGGPYLSYYKKLVAIKRLGNIVKFTGFLERKTLIKYFYAIDCFLMPSQKLEGFGLVILEALYNNIPIIATPVGAIPEILVSIPDCRMSKSKAAVDFAQELLGFITRKNTDEITHLRKYFLSKFKPIKNVVNQIINF